MKRLLSAGLVLLPVFAASSAQARCTINAAGVNITPVTGSTGTYTPPTAPVSQSVTFTITGTYNTNATAGTCRVGIAFNRATLPATMTRSGGGATLPYSIRTAAGTGGISLIFTGGGVPAAANILTSAFVSAGPNLTNVPFTRTVTAFFTQQPGSPQRAGSYSDNPTVRIYNIRQNGTVTELRSVGFTVTGVVSLACTIGGVVTAAPDAATIPVGAMGTVNTTPISRTYVNVICNSLSAIVATSQNGAVRRAVAPPGGFTNIINYSAIATFAGASSTLNTATVPAAAGPEAGSTGTTASSTPTGSLAVTITPQAPVLPLVSGGYSDTLKITTPSGASA